MRIINQTTFLLVLLLLFILTADGQAGGGGFNSIKVLDSKGKNVPDVTIEIIAQLLREEYKDVKYKYGKAVKIPAKKAQAAVKKRVPIDYTRDIFCKNPLRQIAGQTKVKRFGEQFPPSVGNFGFCTGETYLAPLVLKVSAPGYLPGYYIGNFLGGCGAHYELILMKRKINLETLFEKLFVSTNAGVKLLTSKTLR